MIDMLDVWVTVMAVMKCKICIVASCIPSDQSAI